MFLTKYVLHPIPAVWQAVAFGMMFGGKKGAMWVINTAISPIKAAFRAKLTALIYLCMFVIVSYYVGAKIAHALGF